MKKIAIAAIAIIAIAGAVYIFRGRITEQVFKPNDTATPSADPEPTSGEPEVVAQNLRVPWEIAFLPSGDMLVTERTGTLKRIGKTTDSFPVNGAKQAGEGGLLGLALHPDFSSNQFLYLYFTTADRTNKVVRYKFTDRLIEDKVIIENIPGAANHDGGRIAFGPDKKLYITTGDAQTESNAQNTSTLAGKILRLNDDGSVPSDNPFSNPVWSYGHRNPQGLAWDSQSRLWATEHGPSGTGSGFDEVNLIGKGKNYGWPTIQGDETRSGMETPIIQSGAKATWAPADILIVGNTLYFAGLRGQSLYSATINGAKLTNLTSRFASKYGRLRALAEHDGYLYFSTSNQDGRGKIQTNDDKIYRLKL